MDAHTTELAHKGAQDTHLFDAATFSDAALDAAAALVRRQIAPCWKKIGNPH